ncbi:MAG: hypothetical protein AAFP24_06385 [Pseudomonadota bacterium]
MRDEMFTAGAISAEGQKIDGVVEQLEFNSFGTGAWDIQLKLSSSSLPDGYSVSNSYSFKTSFSALSACQNVIDAFTPAVQELIAKAIADPSFEQLSGK